MTKEHDYYKETEYLLYNYKMFKINIKNMESEIEYLKKDDGMTGINYDGISTSSTNMINSITENTALSISEKIHFLERRICKENMTLEKIDRAIKGLTETERIIIEQRYIEGKQWWQVAYKANYGERHCKRLRSEAIGKMVIGIFGVE